MREHANQEQPLTLNQPETLTCCLVGNPKRERSGKRNRISVFVLDRRREKENERRLKRQRHEKTGECRSARTDNCHSKREHSKSRIKKTIVLTQNNKNRRFSHSKLVLERKRDQGERHVRSELPD